MNTLHMTQAELYWLIDKLSGMNSYWPPPGHPNTTLVARFLHDTTEWGGGMPLRLRLIAAWRKISQSNYRTIPVPVSVNDAWLLDEVLWSQPGDLRFNFTMDTGEEQGTALIGLAKQIYDILISAHADDLPPYLRPGGPTDGDPIAEAKSKADEVYNEVMRQIEEAA